MRIGETCYFSKYPALSEIRNRTAGSDIGKALRSSHYATSLSIVVHVGSVGLQELAAMGSNLMLTV